jgi:hypothetical protein
MLARSAYRTAAALGKVRRSSPPGSLPTTTRESADSYACFWIGPPWNQAA